MHDTHNLKLPRILYCRKQVGPDFVWEVSEKQLFQVSLNSEALKSRFLCVWLKHFLFLQSALELLIGEIVFKAPVCGVIRFQIQTKWRELDMCYGSRSVEMCRNIYRSKCYFAYVIIISSTIWTWKIGRTIFFFFGGQSTIWSYEEKITQAINIREYW